MTYEFLRDQTTLVSALSGEVNRKGILPFRVEILKLIQQGLSKVVLDLEMTIAVDSAALAVFFEVYKTCYEKKVKLILCHANPQVQGMLEITRLDTLFHQVSSRKEALL